jgi:TonB family protein
MTDFYPPAQLDAGRGGRVELTCVVSADGKLSCSVVSETPDGKGFGNAALRASTRFRIAAATLDGKPTSGGRINIPIRFEPPRE